MVDIDEEKLQNLMELVIKEHPDLDAYVLWIKMNRVYMVMKN